MREIKFRAWNTVIGRYDYFTLEDALISDNSRISKKMLNDDFTFEQFTGLTDKKGVEIYEGDIVKLYYSSWLDTVSLVVFDKIKSSFGYSTELCFTSFDLLSKDIDDGPLWVAMEVIGNIHQHQHLISNKQVC